MCLYKPEVTGDDRDFLISKRLVKKMVGANSCRIHALLEDGTTLDSGEWASGETTDPSDWYRRSVYGRVALAGHLHDAELKALSTLGVEDKSANARGTLYVIGSSGPCDSCRAR